MPGIPKKLGLKYGTEAYWSYRAGVAWKNGSFEYARRMEEHALAARISHNEGAGGENHNIIRRVNSGQSESYATIRRAKKELDSI